MEIKKINYFGYNNCLLLNNNIIKIILLPSVGGKIIEFSKNGLNALYQIEEERGWLYNGNNSIISSAGRFDVGPEMVIPPHPDLWYGKWKVESIKENSVTISSDKDLNTKIKLIRKFELDKKLPLLNCTQFILNFSNKTIYNFHWGRTMAKGDGICIIPIKGISRYPNKYVSYINADAISFSYTDKNIIEIDNCIIIKDKPLYPKIGFDSSAGKIYYLMKNNMAFVKKFKVSKNWIYNEIGAINCSIFYYNDGNMNFCELEPIGPSIRIPPGSSVSFSEQWYLVDYMFPSDSLTINPKDTIRLINKNL